MRDSRDAYLRLPVSERGVHQRTPLPGGLTFIDLAGGATSSDVVAAQLRSVPLELLANADSILFRHLEEPERSVAARSSGPWRRWRNQLSPPTVSTDSHLSRLTEQLRSMGISRDVGVGLLIFAPSKTPTIVWESGDARELGDLLPARARSVELDAFLSWGRAIWKPTGYHYELPSGKHASTFLRLADVFQDRRAAGALATWLLVALAPNEPTNVVLDVGTLMPLVRELELLSSLHTGPGVGQVLALDRYPENALGLQRSLLSQNPESPVLGIVSVSDSGGFADRLVASFKAYGAAAVRVEQIVSRRGLPAVSLPSATVQGSVPEDPWLVVPQELEDSGSGCAHCSDPATARLVRVNPRSMSAMVLPDPQLIVPHVFEAVRNQNIWERYSQLPNDRSVSYQGTTGTRPPVFDDRTERSSVMFEPALLMKHDPDELIKRRVQELSKLRSGEDEDIREVVAKRLSLVQSRSRVVVFEPQDRALFDDDEWTAVRKAIAESDFCSEDAEWISHDEVSTRTASQNPETVLVLSLGFRTGLTLQRSFLDARSAWPDGTFSGLVVHSHPVLRRSWRSVQNTFTDSFGNRRLLALWVTYLPNRSPLLEERQVLVAARRSGFKSNLARDRIAAIKNGLPAGEMLWGVPNPVLEPNSYFGEKLDDQATLLAVGSAMQFRRLESAPAAEPDWVLFNLRRAFRSYFDGLIHAAILRWTEPHEAYWGRTNESKLAFVEQLHGVDFDFNKLLLPELLLATAQEKLPYEAGEYLGQIAESQLSAASINPRTADFLELGVELLEHTRKLEIRAEIRGNLRSKLDEEE